MQISTALNDSLSHVYCTEHGRYQLHMWPTCKRPEQRLQMSAKYDTAQRRFNV